MAEPITPSPADQVDQPVSPIIVAHRDMSEGPPVRWGRWYLHAIFESGDLTDWDLEADQYAAFDARGRRLDMYHMPERMDVLADEGDALDLELLLRRHLREREQPGAEDPALSLNDLITAVGPKSDPGLLARAGFSVLFVCLVVLPWFAGAGLAVWAVTELI